MDRVPQWIAVIMLGVIGWFAVMDRGHFVQSIDDLKHETREYRAEAKACNDKQTIHNEKVLEMVQELKSIAKSQNHVIDKICDMISIPYNTRMEILKENKDWRKRK